MVDLLHFSSNYVVRVHEGERKGMRRKRKQGEKRERCSYQSVMIAYNSGGQFCGGGNRLPLSTSSITSRSVVSFGYGTVLRAKKRVGGNAKKKGV